MPAIDGVKETCLYVEDLARARQFYEGVLGLRVMLADTRFCAYDAGGCTVLLLFVRGGSAGGSVVPGGVIPPHDGIGGAHVGFAIARDQLPAWEELLAARAIPVESTVDWPRGGRSIYFRDPDRHLVELLTPGVWAIY